MKTKLNKKILFLSIASILYSQALLLADYENYDGEDVSGRKFSSSNYNGSMLYSSWIGAIAIDTNFLGVNLAYANFTDANLTNAVFGAYTNLYKVNFTNANLTNAKLNDWNYLNLTDASFNNAIIEYTDFTRATYNDLNKNQIYSTASYKNKKLIGLKLDSNFLNDWSFSEQDLTNASFQDTILRNTNFTDSIITNTNFSKTTAKGFTKEQLYSTSNYKNKNLTGVNLSLNDLTSWDFSNQNLTGASFYDSTLTDADFTNAIIKHTSFSRTTSRGFTKEQLYSTASYKNKDLTEIVLIENNLEGWNFRGQILSAANFASAILTDADFTDAIIFGVKLSNTTDKGFTKEQLYSTASYANKNLRSINLSGNDLSNWNFSGQNLQNANFESVSLKNTNMTSADLRGANLSDITGTPIYKNTIMTDGRIENFSMTSADDSLLIRKYEPVNSGGALRSAKLDTSSTISGGAILTLERGADFEVTNNSTLSVAQGSGISINTDASSSTSFSILDGSSLIFEDGAILEVNIEGITDANTNLSFIIFDWQDDATFENISEFVEDENLILSVNGEKFDGDWNYNIDNNKFIINISQVPEPAAYAAIFGALALFIGIRRGKRN